MLCEVRRAGDETAQPEAALDAIKIAIERHIRLRQNIDGAELGRFLALFQAHRSAELAGISELALRHRQLPGNEDDVAGGRERHVICRRCGWRRERNTEFLKAS